jgi:hypothetical protein
MDVIESGINESAQQMHAALQKELLNSDSGPAGSAILEGDGSASDLMDTGVSAQWMEESASGWIVLCEGAARCARYVVCHEVHVHLRGSMCVFVCVCMCVV